MKLFGCVMLFLATTQAQIAFRQPQVIRFFRSRICRFLPRTVFVCCPLGGNQSPPAAPPRHSNSNLASIIPSESICGSPSGSRVVGGDVIEYPGRWPWLAAVGFRQADGTFRSDCGGTLITRHHVLTAAHCFNEPGKRDPEDIRLGEFSLTRSNDGGTPQDFRISSKRDNGYNRRTKENDIMLLIMDRDVQFTDKIAPACLPFNERNNNFEGTSLTVVGWGRTTFDSRTLSDVPMEARVPVVNTRTCNTNYQAAQGDKPVVDQRHLCAGSASKDSCSGDSGGPLNYKGSSGKYYIVGIVSFGVGCARPEFPGVYTRVSSFIDWIVRNAQ
uniref:limulus clotting factor C n=1 Tax=Pacifastacus leniusculus TaxID=6720 RepID=A0A220YLG0_PACLE|nr:serine protease cSP [Pacifastacus leniusculus]